MRCVFLFLISIFLCCQASAQEIDKVVVLQDEVFFLHNELAQLKLALAEKDEAFKRTVIEKEALASKVNNLQHAVLERDKDLPRLMAQADGVYRSQVDDMKSQLKAMELSVAQKTDQLGVLQQEKEALKAKMDMLEGEKISLRQSLKTVVDEVDSLERQVNDRVSEEKALAQERELDLKMRLSAEQALVQEKIALAKKLLEDKVAVFEGQLKAKDAEWSQKLIESKAVFDEKVRKLEQQIVVLRESAGQEIRKVQDAARADVVRVKEQLTACQSRK